MAWYEILLIGLSCISLLVILVIYIRHRAQIGAINVHELADEKQRQLKKIMAEQRLVRKLQTSIQQTTKIFKPLISLFKTQITRLQKKIKDLEERYTVERLTVKSITKQGQESLQQRIEKLLELAVKQYESEEYTEAEATYISIIKLDPQSIDAFMGLGVVYGIQKKYNQALEVYGYVLKVIEDQNASEVHLAALGQRDVATDAQAMVATTRARVYFFTAQIKKDMGAYEECLDLLQKTVELEPANPKYLDALLDISIIQKDKKLANETFFKLKKANPDNKKLDEYQELLTGLL